MTRIYKGLTIQRGLNSRWIVTYADGSHSAHRTLRDAKDAVTISTYHDHI
jgi:hypothetical protein